MAELSFKQIVKEKIMDSIITGHSSQQTFDWKVLVLDPLTTRILSSCCRMSEITDKNISVVEDITKERAHLKQEAIYFISPTEANIQLIKKDFQAANPRYTDCHIYFSSSAPAHLLTTIKNSAKLVAKLKTLKEANLELLMVDSRTFTTDQDLALVNLYKEQISSTEYQNEIETTVQRLLTLFSTIKEFPSIRYRAGKPTEQGDPPGQEKRNIVPQKVASILSQYLGGMQRNGRLPNRETCDLVIVDRSYDCVAPFIHEWTYEAMVHDMLDINRDNMYQRKAKQDDGSTIEQVVVLDENDDTWNEVRHEHIAVAIRVVTEQFNQFMQKNEAAKYSHQAMQGGSQLKNIKSVISALPEYRKVLTRLSLHYHILDEKIFPKIEYQQLRELGELEQGLVYGDLHSHDLITYLQSNPPIDAAEKIRLLMCYLATHPGKMDTSRKQQYRRVAELSAEQMTAVTALQYLGVAISKQEPKTLGFLTRKSQAVYKDRGNPQAELLQLARFQPLLVEVLEGIAKKELSTEAFPYVKKPSGDDASSGYGSSQSGVPAQSVRQRASVPVGNWAKGKPGQQEAAASKKRLIIFVIGGITRSEMRVAHQLANSLGRDVIIGSTSVDTPKMFIEKVTRLPSNEDFVR